MEATAALRELSLFLNQNQHLTGDYEVWGESNRPIRVLTMDGLRTVHEALDAVKADVANSQGRLVYLEEGNVLYRDGCRYQVSGGKLYASEAPQSSEPDRGPETVLEEAQRLIYGPRMAEYGSALVSFGRIAGLWNAYLIGRELIDGAGGVLSEEDVALLLVLLKMARAMEDLSSERPVKRDSVVDIAGYAGCVQKVTDDRAELVR